MMGPGPVRAAFQGELGAYSHEALRAFLGDRAEPVPCRTFQEVGDRTASGETAFGLLPVENTLAGAVTGSYDVLATTPLAIVGEVIIPIRHCLLGPQAVPLEDLERVLSHPVALAQCRAFLNRYVGMDEVAYYDTAGAAREVAKRCDPATAAIASRLAAERYRLEILAEGIEDRTDNQTRFFVLAAEEGSALLPAPPKVGATKAVILAEVPNGPGALMRLLAPFAERGINLTNLEGRPTGDPWQYRFILEMRVPDARADLHEALKVAEGVTTRFRVLGICMPAEGGDGGSDLSGPAAAP